MLNFSIKKSLLMTTGLLMLNPFTTCAADGDYNNGLTPEQALAHAMALSAQGDQGYDPVFAREQEELQLALALSAQGDRYQPVAAVGDARALLAEKPEAFAAGQQQRLIDLAKSILARPAAIRSELISFMDNNFTFIEAPGCALERGINLPECPLNLEEIKNKVHVDLKAFCEKQGCQYDVVLPLFANFWDKIIRNPCFGQFSETYQNLFKIVMANKADIDGLLLKINNPEGGGVVIPGGPMVPRDPIVPARQEDLFKERLENLGIMRLHENLKRQQAYISDEFLPLFTRMSVPDFWNQSPKIDLAHLLVEQKAGADQPRVEKKEPVVIRRPALYPILLDFQKHLNREFKVRESARGDETVMAYASHVAKHFYKELDQHINALWGRLEFSRAMQVKDISQIIALHNTVKGKEDLEHTEHQSAAIKATLELSFQRHTRQPMYNYLTDITQYDYLLMVSSQLLRFNEAFRKDNKDLANTLLGIFFDALIDQSGFPDIEQNQACQGGMTGRLLMVHKITLDMLIEHYNTPIKVVPVAPPAAEEERKDPERRKNFEEDERKAPEQAGLGVAPPGGPVVPAEVDAAEDDERKAPEQARAAVVPPVGVQGTYQERLQGWQKNIGPMAWKTLRDGDAKANKLFDVIASMPEAVQGGKVIEIFHSGKNNYFRIKINGALQPVLHYFRK